MALTAALLLPISAHSTAELGAWYSEWLATPETSDIKVELLRDMEARHPCFPEVCQPKEVIASEFRPNVGAVATPPPTIAGVEQWRTLVAAYTWDVDRMLRIMACETVPDGNPDSLNPSSGAAGLFQIMPFWQKTWPGDYFDPWTNVAVAYQVWLEQGYGAWVCRG